MALMRNPSYTEWPAEQVLRAMAKHQQVLSQQSSDVSSTQDFLSVVLSFQWLGTVIRKHLSKETAKILTTPRLPPIAACPPEISTDLSMRINVEWQQVELKLLSSLLEEMQKADACAVQEMTILDKMLMTLLLHQQHANGSKEVADLASLVKSERAERDLANARLRHQEMILALERAVPFRVFHYLALCSMASISLETSPSASLDVSFPSLVEGPQPCIRREMDGVVYAYVKPEEEATFVHDGNPTIPAHSIAASFFRSLLFTIDESPQLHPSILKRVRSNGFTEIVISLSNVIGRVDLAVLDLQRVVNKPYVHIATVESQGDILVHLSIFCQEFQVNFCYDRQCQRSLTYAIPSCVSVMQAGVRTESLEAVAKRTMQEMSIEATWCCLERICDACFFSSRSLMERVNISVDKDCVTDESVFRVAKC